MKQVRGAIVGTDRCDAAVALPVYRRGEIRDVSPPVPEGTKIAEITGDQGTASDVQGIVLSGAQSPVGDIRLPIAALYWAFGAQSGSRAAKPASVASEPLTRSSTERHWSTGGLLGTGEAGEIGTLRRRWRHAATPLSPSPCIGEERSVMLRPRIARETASRRK
jgi:hypothetical protein